MTAEDEKKLVKACKLVKEIFPNMCGYVRFHLHPEQRKVICKVEYSIMIQPDKYFNINKEKKDDKQNV